MVASASAPARSKVFPLRTRHQLLHLPVPTMNPPRATIGFAAYDVGIAIFRGRFHYWIGHM